MYTLSDASRQTKTAIKILIISVIIMVVVFFIVKGIFAIKEALFPTPPPKPTLLFNKLPAISFPNNSTTTNLTYKIDTLTGIFQQLPTQARVYEIVKPQPDLLAVRQARSMAATAGFKSEEAEISNRIFEWVDNPLDPKGLKRSIRIDTLSYSFNIYSQYSSDAAVLSSKNLSNQKGAISKSQSTLSGMGLLTTDIDVSKTQTHLYSIKNNALVSATSLSNAQIIQVVFYQQNVNNLPIYYEKPNSSNINFLIGSGQVVGASFMHQEVSDRFGTYPIKAVQKAFEELQKGKGYIASYYGSSNKISIRNAFLAYYMSNQQQDFLMPIIVFQGDNGFFAYVSAVTDELINK